MKKNKSTCGKLNPVKLPSALFNRVNIGLDFDGVIIDHAQNKIKSAESLGFKIKKRETPSEILENILPRNEYKKLQKMIYGKLTLKSPPLPFSLKIIGSLSSQYNLYIISRRKNPRIALSWLKKHKVFKNISPENIFFTKEEKEKNRVAKKLKIKVYLDDKVKVLKSLSSVPHRIFLNPCRIPVNKKFLEIRGDPVLSTLARKKQINLLLPRSLLIINSWKEFPKLLEKLKRTN